MGRVLAVDPGTVRVGLAISDPLRITAQPLEVVDAGEALDKITDVVRDQDVEEVIVGLPRTERGEEGEAAVAARNLASQIRERTGVAVIEIDERYTTRIAEQAMIQAGVRRRERRQAVDKVAAAVLLRGYLDGGGK